MDIVRTAALPFSWLYGAVISLRNLFYDTGIFRIEEIDVPIISVGNLSTGGTGKTPFVEFLLRYLLGKDKIVAVLSRGYGRKTRGTVVIDQSTLAHCTAESVGDEPYQIARKFPGAIVIVDESRVRGARIAKEKYRVDAIILDDGLQHRALKRNLEIVMIDGMNPITEMAMLPAGLRREPLVALRRADLLIFSRVADTSAEDDKLKRYSDAPRVSVLFQPRQFHHIPGGKTLSLKETVGKTCVAFCGIGNPKSFRKSLESIGLKIREFLAFPDHYTYQMADLHNIGIKFQESRADMILTTEKDATRLTSLQVGETTGSNELYYLEIEARVTEGESTLQDLIDSALDRGRL